MLDNIKVYDLQESIIASGYPMRTDNEKRVITDKDKKRILNLTSASNGNGSHGQWLTGVRVAFDLTCSIKMWTEAERYRFLEFVSSQSTMHRITKFDIKEQCNSYVDSRIIDILNAKVNEYNRISNLPVIKDSEVMQLRNEELKELYLEILYSVPTGFNLTARMTTNYRCLLNIYIQRYNHKLPEWQQFCQELLELPMFIDLVDAYKQGGSNG